MQSDIVERLKFWLPMHVADLTHEENGRLGDHLRDAIAEIEYLRSLTGPVSRGGNFADIAAGVLACQPKLPEVS